MGCGLLQITPSTNSLLFTQKPLLLLVLEANQKGICRLENWDLFRRGLLWDYEESEMCATYTQSFCAWKAKSVVVIYYSGGVNTVVTIFHWNFPLQICTVNGSHRGVQL